MILTEPLLFDKRLITAVAETPIRADVKTVVAGVIAVFKTFSAENLIVVFDFAVVTFEY